MEKQTEKIDQLLNKKDIPEGLKASLNQKKEILSKDKIVKK
ncbi:hypothetical protein [Chryseobacterium mucoviscidosis]